MRRIGYIGASYYLDVHVHGERVPQRYRSDCVFLIFIAAATGILGGKILFDPAFRMIRMGFQMYRGSPKEMEKRSTLNGTGYDRGIIVANAFKIIGGGFGLWIVFTMFVNNYSDFMVAGIYYITFFVVIVISVFLDIRVLWTMRRELKKEKNDEK